jgi:hypothetical protein
MSDPNDSNTIYWFPSQMDITAAYHIDVMENLAAHILTTAANTNSDLFTYEEAMRDENRNE